MLVSTILNHVQRFKSFVYSSVRWGDSRKSFLLVTVEPRSNSLPVCSKCFRKRPGYDRLPERRFEFVPLWNIKVFLVCRPRRVECPDCGVRVESLPWTLPAAPNSPLTEAFAWFLAPDGRSVSPGRKRPRPSPTSWDAVFRSVCMAVDWGRAHLDLSGIVSPSASTRSPGGRGTTT